MVQHLFPRFLDDPAEYAKAEAFWRSLWDELARFSGQQQEWRHPWLQTAYADGTPFHDGDPIFSAWCPSRKVGVRVIQNAPQQQELELNWWLDTVGDEWSGGEVHTLVISCALSRQAADLARDFILSWMRDGRVSVSRSQGGLPVVAAARRKAPVRLQTTVRPEAPPEPVAVSA
jgi:hypothetical protein